MKQWLYIYNFSQLPFCYGLYAEVCVLQDKFLDRFLSLNTVLEEGNIPARIGEANMESELKAR
jgi:hypothetical protein